MMDYYTQHLLGLAYDQFPLENGTSMKIIVEGPTADPFGLASRPAYHAVLHHQQIDNIREGMRKALAADDAKRGAS